VSRATWSQTLSCKRIETNPFGRHTLSLIFDGSVKFFQSLTIRNCIDGCPSRHTLDQNNSITVLKNSGHGFSSRLRHFKLSSFYWERECLHSSDCCLDTVWNGKPKSHHPLLWSLKKASPSSAYRAKNWALNIHGKRGGGGWGKSVQPERVSEAK